VLTFGEHSERIVTGAITGGIGSKRALHFESQDEMASALRRMAKRGDVLLFKGSRGMHMEQVLKQFLETTEKN